MNYKELINIYLSIFKRCTDISIKRLQGTPLGELIDINIITDCMHTHIFTDGDFNSINIYDLHLDNEDDENHLYDNTFKTPKEYKKCLKEIRKTIYKDLHIPIEWREEITTMEDKGDE